MITAGAARATTDSVTAAAARGPVDQVYAQIVSTAQQGLGTTIVGFAPFSFPVGGSTDPAAAPFLNELAANGFVLTASVDGDGTTSLQVSW